MKAITAKKIVVNKPRRTTPIDAEMGNRLKLRRLELDMSQAELGQRLGVSFQQVQKYEKGSNRIGAGRLAQIAAALQVPVTFFYEHGSKAREVETLLAIDAAFSLRLLRAYSSVQNNSIRRLFVSMIESVAEIEGGHAQ